MPGCAWISRASAVEGDGQEFQMQILQACSGSQSLDQVRLFEQRCQGGNVVLKEPQGFTIGTPTFRRCKDLWRQALQLAALCTT